MLKNLLRFSKSSISFDENSHVLDDISNKDIELSVNEDTSHE